MMRSLAVFVVLGLLAFNVVVGRPEFLDEAERDRAMELLEETHSEEEKALPGFFQRATAFPIVGKPTEQSTTLYPYRADKAVDGSDSTSLYSGKKCSHTEGGANNPWWRVDLQGEHCISIVTILNRGDCCSERLENAVVRAGTSVLPTDNEACGSPVTAAEAAPAGGTIQRFCRPPLRARYVSVDIPGSATLQLCEVKVKESRPGWCRSRTIPAR